MAPSAPPGSASVVIYVVGYIFMVTFMLSLVSVYRLTLDDEI